MADNAITVVGNVTRDPEGRHTGFSGFTPGDQMVKVFTCNTPASGRSPRPTSRRPRPNSRSTSRHARSPAPTQSSAGPANAQ